MTDNDIIKALECCGELFPNPCSQCPYLNTTPCVQLKRDALDLINSQKAEIEKFERTVSHLEDYSNGIADKVKSEAIKEITDGLVTMFLNINESLNCEDIVENIKRFSSRLTEGRENG